MKKVLLLLTLPFLVSLTSCNFSSKNKGDSSISDSIESSSEQSSELSSEESSESSIEESSEEFSEEDYKAIDKELKGCYEYFKWTTNLTDGSSGYGLTQDRLTNRNMSSIAATGFVLGSYPVFVEQGYMTKKQGLSIVSKTLDTILRIQTDSTTSYAGCFSHFVSRETGKRYGTSEISTIDTAILISGAITASEYFRGDTLEKAKTLWSNVDYTQFIIKKNSKSYISMGVNDPEKQVQLSPWDYYAEQLMIYILGAGNPNPDHRISSLLYKNITKNKGTYGGIEHIYSWFGSLFTYQFSQAFYNFKNYNDYKGNNYFDNSVKASQTAYLYCQVKKDNYPTFSENSWGLTACDTPLGYSGDLGTPPRGFGGNSVDYLRIEGTVAPTAALGSMPFTPRESLNALKYYQSLPKLCDEDFGLRDAFNLDFNGSEWYDADYIGIDKGIEVMQLYNFKNTDFVSNLAMQNENVILGFTNNGFVEIQ